jgi:hypothetical protein
VTTYKSAAEAVKVWAKHNGVVSIQNGFKAENEQAYAALPGYLRWRQSDQLHLVRWSHRGGYKLRTWFDLADVLCTRRIILAVPATDSMSRTRYRLAEEEGRS